jgi:hypothetical protein
LIADRSNPALGRVPSHFGTEKSLPKLWALAAVVPSSNDAP